MFFFMYIMIFLLTFAHFIFVSIAVTCDVAVLHGHKNFKFAHDFKHCGFKTSDFKPLKCNQLRKRTHFAICARCLSDCFWALSERCSREHGAHRSREYWTELSLPLYRPWMIKLLCLTCPEKWSCGLFDRPLVAGYSTCHKPRPLHVNEWDLSQNIKINYTSNTIFQNMVLVI